jgi:hypothetical protein
LGRTTIWKNLQMGDGTVSEVAEVQQPHRAPTIESDILVPLAEALISGFVVGIALAMLLIWQGHYGWWPTLPICIAVMTGVGWLAALREERQTLWHTETMTVLNTQPAALPPAPQTGLLLANPIACATSAAVAARDEHKTQRQAELVAFVRRCAVKGCGESSHDITPATRAAYLGNRDLLLGLGLANWKTSNHKAGWELSAPPADCVVLLRRHVIGR